MEIEKVNSIRDSTFPQKYTSIQRKDNKKECMHCEKKHQIKICASKETNQYLADFQKLFRENADKSNKLETMIGAATVSQDGKIVKAYITHSGKTTEGIKKIYEKMGAKIIDYKEEKTKMPEDDESCFLYGIHTDSALNINGEIKTLYGECLKSYSIDKQLLEQKEAEFINKKKLEIEKEIETYNIELSKLENSPQNQNKLIEIRISRSSKIKNLCSLKNNLSNLKENVNAYALQILKKNYGRNFGKCAAQKILQQISKDFSKEFDAKKYVIHMSETWVQKHQKKHKWSQIHPVPPCRTCAYILPNLLCEPKTVLEHETN